MIDPGVNFGKVRLSTGYDNAAVSVTLQTGDGAKLPTPSTDGAFNVVYWNSSDYGDPTDDPNREIVRVTARSGDVLTISRAQEGTSATIKNQNGKSYQMILGVTAKTITDLKNALPSLPNWAKETPSGTIDGVNLIYYVTNIPIAYSGDLILNGQPFTEGVDYTVDVAHKKITLSTPIPAVASSLPFIFKYQY